MFWPFTVWINCSSDLKKFAISQPSFSNFKSFSLSLEQHFLTVGQNNFGNKIPLFSLFGNGCLTTVWNDKPRTRQQFVNVQTPVDYLLDGSRGTEEAVQSKVTWIVWQVCLTYTATPNRVEQGACRVILNLLLFFPGLSFKCHSI